MAMSEYFLRIDRFTQNRFTGDPEVDVNPERIDREKNLHVYLTGNIRPDRRHPLNPPQSRRTRHRISPTPNLLQHRAIRPACPTTRCRTEAPYICSRPLTTAGSPGLSHPTNSRPRTRC